MVLLLPDFDKVLVTVVVVVSLVQVVTGNA